MAQSGNWLGIVQEVEGKWDLLDSGGRRIGGVRMYLAIPDGSSVKIADQSGRASGRLTIALKDGSAFIRCCSASCKTRDNDCNEAVRVQMRDTPHRAPWADLFERIGALLSRAPERFPVPAIGGRSIVGASLMKELLLVDGVFVASEDSLDANAIIRPTADARRDRTYWIKVAKLNDGQPVEDNTAPIRFDAFRSHNPITIGPGLYQFSLLTGANPINSGLNAWALLVRSGEDPAISSYASLVKATDALDFDTAGMLRRAYLTELSRDSRP
jgi:hypothetical protein